MRRRRERGTVTVFVAVFMIALLAVAGLVTMAPGIGLAVLGKAALGEPLAAIGSIATLAAMLLFGFIVFATPRRMPA